MKLKYDEIKIKKKLLIFSGELDICENSINIIKGKNGAGKTTLIKQLYFKNKSNAVYVDQSNEEIINELSIVENISMSESNSINNEIRSELKKLKLDYLLDRNVKTLSGGEKRLISILRGLLSSSSLILMDEPTNDLDYKIVNKIINLIKYYASEKTFIIITHDDRIDKMANKIFILENKKIEERIIREGDISLSDNKIFKNQEKNKYKLEILNKVFRVRILSIITMMIILVFSIVSINQINNIKKNKDEIMNSDEIDVFIPISSMGSEMLSFGSLPTQLIGMINSKSIKINDISEKIEELMNEPINFWFEIGVPKNSKEYPIIYFDVLTKGEFNLLYHIIEDKYNIDSEAIYIDRDDISINKYGIEVIILGKEYFISNEEFDSMNKKFEETMEERESLKKTYSIIKSDEEINGFEYITDSGLDNTNLYFRCNDSINLKNQIKAFDGFRNILIFSTLCSGIIILYELLFTYLYLLKKQKSILIFINYGFKGKKFIAVLKIIFVRLNYI